ncbi:MAG: mechanosensitive ion channel [Rhodocyclaceae bacterium]|nr:mechanosensitive ion channel [Rhodocyclaceae bacterium]
MIPRLLALCVLLLSPAAWAAGDPAGTAPAPVVFQQRTIAELRVPLLAYSPSERARSAEQRLRTLAGEGRYGPVELVPREGGVAVLVGGSPVLMLLPGDTDSLGGETHEQLVHGVRGRLEQALGEAAEAREPARLLRAAAWALGATLAALAALLAGARISARLGPRLIRRVRGLDRATPAGAGRLGLRHLARHLPALGRGATWLAGAGLVYVWLVFVLLQFPVTRPLGETLGRYLTNSLADLGLGMLHAIPGLLTVVVVLLAARFLSGLVNRLFDEVDAGRLRVPLVDPETALPTRRILVVILWLAAVVVAYPYLPGGQSEAFKALSVFVGVVVSLGSSGIVSQAMGGLLVVYARAMKVGDFVLIGQTEGTVVETGLMATRILTRLNEVVTLPNALVAAGPIVNYSREANALGLRVPAKVTIGYDTPWRQVHAMLVEAARQTRGIRAEPAPFVWQKSLMDFYVEYQLNVHIEDPAMRNEVLSDLHAAIQDVFNRHGVQIMSPNYFEDPREPKLVPPERWYEAPAKPPPPP